MSVEGSFFPFAKSARSDWSAQTKQLEGQKLHCSAEASLWLNTAGRGIGGQEEGETPEEVWTCKGKKGERPGISLGNVTSPSHHLLQTPATRLLRMSSLLLFPFLFSTPTLSLLFFCLITLSVATAELCHQNQHKHGYPDNAGALDEMIVTWEIHIVLQIQPDIPDFSLRKCFCSDVSAALKAGHRWKLL